MASLYALEALRALLASRSSESSRSFGHCFLMYSFNWLVSVGPNGSSDGVSAGVSEGSVAACPFITAGHLAMVWSLSCRIGIGCFCGTGITPCYLSSLWRCAVHWGSLTVGCSEAVWLWCSGKVVVALCIYACPDVPSTGCRDIAL